MEYKSLKEIIEIAIEKEAEAFNIYNRAAEQATERSVRKLFEDLAKEEVKHQEILQSLDTSELLGDIHIPKSTESRSIDFLVDKPIESVDNIQDVFIFAMKRERLAQQFYEDTAKAVSDSQTQELLFLLAEEEKNHLDRLETMYDEKILTEN